MSCFCPFFEDFRIGVSDSRLIVNENGISIHENLRLGVDNQKRITEYVANGSLKTLSVFFTHRTG